LFLVRTVAEIEAGDIHTSLHHVFQHRALIGCRAQRTDDFRSAHRYKTLSLLRNLPAGLFSLSHASQSTAQKMGFPLLCGLGKQACFLNFSFVVYHFSSRNAIQICVLCRFIPISAFLLKSVPRAPRRIVQFLKFLPPGRMLRSSVAGCIWFLLEITFGKIYRKGSGLGRGLQGSNPRRSGEKLR